MKRKGNLFEQITEIDNLRLAFRKASKGKRDHKAVLRIAANLEDNLKDLQELLLSGGFHTSAYHTKRIHEPKEREIFILPFWPDKVVQHAILNIVAPYWESLFISDSYACLDGRGQHKASKRTMQFTKHYRYLYKADVHRFYPSLDHALMKKIVRKKLKDKRLLAVLDDIIDSTPGEKNIPIGNLMSQWFGNLYLNELDMFVKQTLRVKAYIRYCDDIIVFNDDKEILREWRRQIERFIESELLLTFSKSEIFPTLRGVDFLGYRHFPEGYILLRKSTAKRMRARVPKIREEMRSGAVPDRVRGEAESIYGWASWASSYSFMQSIDLFNLREEAADYAELLRAGKEAKDK